LFVDVCGTLHEVERAVAIGAGDHLMHSTVFGLPGLK
jgi:hypothetical protein